MQSLIISVMSQGMYTLADEETLMHQAGHTRKLLKEVHLTEYVRDYDQRTRRLDPWQ